MVPTTATAFRPRITAPTVATATQSALATPLIHPPSRIGMSPERDAPSGPLLAFGTGVEESVQVRLRLKTAGTHQREELCARSRIIEQCEGLRQTDVFELVLIRVL